jgi:LysM repeat protein
VKKTTLGLFICTLLVLLAPPITWAGPPASNPGVHIVRWGENLTYIARQYGTTVQAIAAANGIANHNRIYAGQRLVIPQGTPPSQPGTGYTYVVRHGDTLSGIAYRHRVSVNSIVQANHILNPNRIYAGQRLFIPGATSWRPAVSADQGIYYVVRRGDTLAKIALRYRTSVSAIVVANNIANQNLIHVGQSLSIPPSKTHPRGWHPGDFGDETDKPGCEHLTFPWQGASLSGIIRAKGTADHEEFGYYKLEYRRNGLDDWHYITGAENPVHNGGLGEWDTRTVENGPYTFRLVVVDRTGNYPPPCEITVRVSNSR